MLSRSLALGGVLYAASVGAQFTGTVTGVSDYRYRGVSLSRERPAAQFTLAYDGPGGRYGGLFASTVEFAGAAKTTVQVVGFLGVAVPITADMHADAGIDYSAFGRDLRDYDYGELYAGISSVGWSARLHYSPNYFDFAQRSLYGEFDASHRLNDRIALVGHVGVLVPTGHDAVAPARYVRNPVDARAGVAFDIAGFDLQVAWVSSNATRAGYPIDIGQHRDTVVVSVSRSF